MCQIRPSAGSAQFRVIVQLVCAASSLVLCLVIDTKLLSCSFDSSLFALSHLSIVERDSHLTCANSSRGVRGLAKVHCGGAWDLGEGIRRT